MSGTHGVFQHRTGYFYTILEEDFCEVYKKDGVNEVCRAYITSILEHLTNKQFEATGSDEDIWVFMSLPEMERRMRKACSQRTIHKEIQSMIKDGYLSKRRATGKATMEYKLNLKKIRNALEALPEPQSCNSATYHLANLQDQSSNSARITLQNDKNDLADLQPRIHIDIPVEETKNKEEDVASFGNDAAPAPENVVTYENGLKRKTNPSLPAVSLSDSQQGYEKTCTSCGKPTLETFHVPAHPEPDVRWLEYKGVPLCQCEDDDTPTEKVPAVRTDQRANTRAQDQSRISSQSNLQAASGKVINVEHGTDASKAIPKRSRGKKPVAIDESPAPVPMPKSDTREIQRRINEHRGYGLEEKVEKIREATAVKTWCNLHTIEEYEQVMRYLTTQDKYWKLDENKYRIGGVTLAKETPKALASLKRPMKAAANGDVAPVDEDYSGFDRYVGNGKEERARMLELYKVMEANGELI